MDKHEIVKRLEYCVENKCDVCQQENGSGFPWIAGRCYGFTERLHDAIAMLKAQEPRAIKNSAGNGICPGCGHIIPAWSSPNYCGYCGQAVKWK